MGRSDRTRHDDAVDPGGLGPADAAARESDAREVFHLARRLSEMVESVSSDEFYWQETHYDHDSRQGRELLFLMANHEWVRATSEIVDITRSDAIETTIRIDVDLSQITHEAFRKRTERLWLPVTVLPPPQTDQHRFEPDLFATVTDPAGRPMPMLPAVDLWHQVSAAMAEIIGKMAVSHLPSPAPDQPRTDHDGHRPEEPPIATRDERLLLSAAIYRMLRREPSQDIGSGRSRPATETLRIKTARESLLRLLRYYVDILEPGTPAAEAGGESLREPQFTPELARRAVKVLQALGESVIVVVLMDHVIGPSVLTVRVPTRKLEVSKPTWYKPWTWTIRPCGRLAVDVLMSTADADRQVQINLPDGVSLDRAADGLKRTRADLPHLDISVHAPGLWRDLSASLQQVFAAQAQGWPQAVVRSFADLAQVKLAAVLRTLRHYESQYHGPPPATDDDPAPAGLHAMLEDLATELDRAEPFDDAARKRLEGIWQRIVAGKYSLSRHTLTDLLNSQTVVARADMIEDIPQRAIPRTATVYVDVAVNDRDYFSSARSSATMSLILMIGVLAFLICWPIVNPKASAPTPEVLAIVLTLFATVQADRIERPDRSTLRGRLFALGNWLIAASVLPAITLAVALAFQTHGQAADRWAAGCVAVQAVFLASMRGGPLMSSGWPRMGKRRTISTDHPDYRHFEALRSDYWRNTTAEALMIGRKAYGYVTWQHAVPGRAAEAISPKLLPLLTWDRGSIVPNESSSVLALLRSGTLSQAATFVVFRGKPYDEWPAGVDDRQVLDLDPGRLAPLDSFASTVDVFVGIRRDEMLTIKNHPLVITLQAAANKLIVLDAQVPVPAPLAGYDDRQWGRVRVALRDSHDIRRLSGFLGTLHDRMRKPENARHIIALQAVPAIQPHVLATSTTGTAAINAKEIEVPVLTSDLDVVHSPAVRSESAYAPTWHAITICADARSNIESEIVDRLISVRPNFQLAGMTYALLHGTAVLMFLVHEPQAEDRTGALAGQVVPRERDLAKELQDDLRTVPALAKVQVLLDKQLSRTQLGPVTEYPLLRIRFHWQDRPGALLNVLDSISHALRDELPSLQQHDWSVSYARLQVLTGQVAYGRLTIRMHIPANEISGWNDGRMKEMGRRIEALAGTEAAGSLKDDFDTPEDPVINITRIKRKSVGESAGVEDAQ